MCGIIYTKDFKGNPVKDKILEYYHNQRRRGINGFGFVEVLERGIKLKRFRNEEDAISALKESKASEILFHHRSPTSVMNTALTNHPILGRSPLYENVYYFIHNGHIWNDDDLKKEHEDIGVEYTTILGKEFNDSESLMHEIIMVVEGLKKPTEINARGGFAFMMIQTDKNNKAKALYYGRNSHNPLKKSFAEGEYLEFSSIKGEIDVPEYIIRKYDYATEEFSTAFELPRPIITPTKIEPYRPRQNDKLTTILLPEKSNFRTPALFGHGMETPAEIIIAKAGEYGKLSLSQLINDAKQDRILEFSSLLLIQRQSLTNLLNDCRTRYTQLKIGYERAISEGDIGNEALYKFSLESQSNNINRLLNVLNTNLTSYQ